MSRECKSCGSQIPIRVVVDNQIKNLQHRRYCLSCVPFGTKSRKHSSTALPEDVRIVNKKEAVRRWQKRQRKERKAKLVEMLGGGCQVCGYNKCFACLDFHHRDRKTKKFSISMDGLLKKWDVLVSEVEKCDLLCHNCHGELHAD